MTRHVLLAVRNGKPTIHTIGEPIDAPGSWGRIIDQHAQLQAQADADGVKARELHYAVRDADHPLVLEALNAEAAKLGERQRAVLRVFVAASRDGGGVWVKPGDRKHAHQRERFDRAARHVGLAKSWDYTAQARSLEARGLLIIAPGEAYAPRSYRPTVRGRLVADALNLAIAVS